MVKPRLGRPGGKTREAPGTKGGGSGQLPAEDEFMVGFQDDDQRLEIVEFQRVDSTSGADLDTPPGALAGLYAALITTCRDELDQWRIAEAELEDIELESAVSPEET